MSNVNYKKKELLLFNEANHIYLFTKLVIYFVDTINTYLLSSYSTSGFPLDVRNTRLRDINGVC